MPEELPELIVIDVMALVSAESLKTPLVLDDESVIVVPDVAVLPYASLVSTVKSPLVVPAVAGDGAVIASCVAAPAFTVKCVVADVSELLLVVSVGEPDVVSL